MLEFALVLAILGLALFILTPRQWEPSQENWHKWAAARILRETSEFPALSMGPLYIVYLEIFSFFRYPFAVTLEYWITHLFTYLAIYFLLRSFVRRGYALLLTIAWIPHLAIIEPGGAIIGIGFACLYFLPGKSRLRNQGHLPPALLAAALSHTIYSAFLAGHIVGKFLEMKQWAFPLPNSFFLSAPSSPSEQLKNVTAGTLRILLLLLLLAVLFVPFSGPDQNHILMDPTYAPIPLDNPVKTAFFVLGTERYVRRTFPEQEWVYQDWYLSTPKAYAEATTITQAIVRKPETVFRNLITNLGSGLQLPLFLLSGAFLGPVSILFLPLPLWGFRGLRQKWREEKNYSQFWSIIMGTSAALLVLALTNFNAARYLVTLLPVGFLLIGHAAGGFCLRARAWFEKNHVKSHVKSNVKSNVKSHVKSNVKVITLGLLLLLFGLFLNEGIIHALVLPNQELPSFIVKQLQIARIASFIVGLVLIALNQKINSYLRKIRESVRTSPVRLSSWLQKVELKGTTGLAIISILLLLSTSDYPLGQRAQLQSLLANENFLSGQEPVSLADSYSTLQVYLHPDTKVLAREYTWVTAFTGVRRENIYQIWSLPPLNSSRERTEEWLRSLDVIMISQWLESPRPLTGTQTYPRYVFHLKPFIEKAGQEGWTEEKIPGYGTVYRKGN